MEYTNTISLVEFPWDELPPEIQLIIASQDFKTWMSVSWAYYNTILQLLGRGELVEFRNEYHDRSPILSGYVKLPKRADARAIVHPPMFNMSPIEYTRDSSQTSKLNVSRQQSSLETETLQESYYRIFAILSSSSGPSELQWTYIYNRIRRLPSNCIHLLNHYSIIKKLTNIDCIRAHIEKMGQYLHFEYALFNFTYLRELCKHSSSRIENMNKYFPGLVTKELSSDEALCFTTCVEYLVAKYDLNFDLEVLLGMIENLDPDCVSCYVSAWLERHSTTEYNREYFIKLLMKQGCLVSARTVLAYPENSPSMYVRTLKECIAQRQFDTDIIRDIMTYLGGFPVGDYGGMLTHVIELIIDQDIEYVSESVETFIMWAMRQPETVISNTTLGYIVEHRALFPNITQIAKTASENPSVTYERFRRIHDMQMLREYYNQLQSYYAQWVSYYHSMERQCATIMKEI